MNQNSHTTIILMGSNINPVENLRQALLLLQSTCLVQEFSNVWENAAIGSPGPNYFNVALSIETTYSSIQLKESVLRPIETRLGRVRTADKNSPRTIDLDIILFDGQIFDPNLWSRLHIALPVSELAPDLKDPINGGILQETARSLKAVNWAIIHPEVFSNLTNKTPAAS